MINENKESNIIPVDYHLIFTYFVINLSQHNDDNCTIRGQDH